jgi:hypothetical protein
LDNQCINKYVDEVGHLVSTAIYRTASEWETIHVHGATIVAETMNCIEAVPASGLPTGLGCTRTFVWGDTNNDLNVDIGDILCVLDAFGGNFLGNCTPDAADLSPCTPDHDYGLSDVLAVLDAFSGVVPDPCLLPCGAAAGGSGTGGPEGGGQGPLGGGSLNVISLTASSSTVSPGGTVNVDVFVSGPTELRGYQSALQIRGGKAGSLTFDAADVNQQRSDFVFIGLNFVTSTDVTDGRLMGALYSGGVDVGNPPKYVGTFTLRASTSASGTFVVDLRIADTSLRDPNNQSVLWVGSGSVLITVTP